MMWKWKVTIHRTGYDVPLYITAQTADKAKEYCNTYYKDFIGNDEVTIMLLEKYVQDYNEKVHIFLEEHYDTYVVYTEGKDWNDYKVFPKRYLKSYENAVNYFNRMVWTYGEAV